MLYRLILTSLLLILTSMIFAAPAYATVDFKWETDAKLEVSDAELPDEDCRVERINIIRRDGNIPGTDNDLEACVFAAKDFKLARYISRQNYYEWGYKLNSQNNYTSIQGANIQSKFHVSPSTNRLSILELSSDTYNSTTLASVDDLTKSLNYVSYDSAGNGVLYQIDESSKRRYFEYYLDGVGPKRYLPVWSIAYSLNGKYAFAWVNTRAHVKIDLVNYKSVVVSHQGGIWPVSFESPSALAITNDGNYGFVGIGPHVYNLQNCGYELTDYLVENDRGFEYGGNLCSKSFYDAAGVAGYQGSVSVPRWVGNEEGLSFRFTIYRGLPGWQTQLPRTVTLSKGLSNLNSIDYLALGDSYSSGEGDSERLADGSSFYVAGTNDKNKCHISSRSYPFLLAKAKGVQSDRMKSVACSGAWAKKDYYGNPQTYNGQYGQLKNKTETEVTSERSKALKNFSPAITKQIEFVRQYKPKAITVTGGGNDVGFGRLMTYCSLPSGIGERGNTCNQAIPNTKQRLLLGDAIKTQYETTTELIKALKVASDSTTIYVVGYPSFISEDNKTCLNAGMLNQRERSIINQSVIYLNDVISAAAKSNGAHYLDIESSLGGGRICEGSEFVTGPLDVLGFDIADRKPEMFHPNSKGHARIASKIEASGFATEPGSNPTPIDTPPPARPELFGKGVYTPTFQDTLLADGVATLGRSLELSVSPGLFLANSRVTFTMYSQEESLGSYTTGEDGGLSTSMKLPKSIVPGYHMVVAEGESAVGKSMRIYQFVEVASGKPGDRDGDGIQDSTDTCQYIKEWYSETTSNNICTNVLSDKPGRGLGNGYGHIISNGIHDGHNWHPTMRSN